MAEQGSTKADRNAEQAGKRQLQQQMEKNRLAVTETVEEIKESINQQVKVAKATVAGVLDYRQQFQNEPLVWSLGALSAGFALGYTMGYAHKETKGSRNKSQVAAFTNDLVNELSLVGNSVVMPTLNARIRELFGFDFSEVLDSIGRAHKKPSKRKPAGKAALATARTRKKKRR